MKLTKLFSRNKKRIFRNTRNKRGGGPAFSKMYYQHKDDTDTDDDDDMPEIVPFVGPPAAANPPPAAAAPANDAFDYGALAAMHNDPEVKAAANKERSDLEMRIHRRCQQLYARDGVYPSDCFPGSRIENRDPQMYSDTNRNVRASLNVNQNKSQNPSIRRVFNDKTGPIQLINAYMGRNRSKRNKKGKPSRKNKSKRSKSKRRK